MLAADRSNAEHFLFPCNPPSLPPQRVGPFWSVSVQFGLFRVSPATKTGTRVYSDVPPERKPERGYVHVFPGMKTGMRAHSPKPPFYETALLSPSDPFWC